MWELVIVLVCLGIVCAAIVGYLMVTYNELIRLKNNVKNSQAQLETQLQRIQKEPSEKEDKVTFAKQFYNDAVTMYNNKLHMFPANIVAVMFGFREESLWDSYDEIA